MFCHIIPSLLLRAATIVTVARCVVNHIAYTHCAMRAKRATAPRPLPQCQHHNSMSSTYFGIA